MEVLRSHWKSEMGFLMIVASYTPKMPKMAAKLESLLIFHHLSHVNGYLNFIKPLLDPNQLFLGSRWCLHLCTLPIHTNMLQ